MGEVKTKLLLVKGAVVAVLVLGVFYWGGFLGKANKKEIIKINADTLSCVVFSDSSRLTLREGAVVDYPKVFDGVERMVNFKGEGYFKIAKNDLVPFVVQTPYAVVKVIGTEFVVQTIDSLQVTKVLVTRGKVGVYGVDTIIDVLVVKKNQTAELHKNGFGQIIPRIAKEDLFWLEGAGVEMK